MNSRCLLFILLTFVTSGLSADWTGIFRDLFTDDQVETAVSSLSNSEITAGLKQALEKGVGTAVSLLGKENGFFKNRKVKIPMPEKLQLVEDGLRKLGQDEIADEFVLTMNRAAESAVPATQEILKDAISNMTMEDAKQILGGADDAATQYFRSSSGDKLKSSILPIVSSATNKAGVTRQYKNLFDQLGFMKNLIDVDAFNLDDYVTDKTLDGLYTMMAKEEKLIRNNPAERTTELLRKVFK